MKLIVCLGNPGKEYEKTRHNIGFRVGDHLIRIHNFDSPTKKFQSHLYSGKIGTEKVYIMKPTTYMNESGKAVQGFCTFYKHSISDIIVIYDDLDIPFGRLRLREKGSAGTHNGIKSIISICNNKDFPRLRVGISAANPYQTTSDFVLANFSNEEENQLETIISTASNVIEALINGDINNAMQLANQKK